MNLKQLRNHLGTTLRLRPLPIRMAEGQVELPPLDDLWRLEDVLAKPSRVMLVNTHTGHVATLQYDNVREFRSPDFLLLRCQLTLTPLTVELEPLAPSDGIGKSRRLFQIEHPSSDISSDEWVSIHGSGAPIGWKILVITWLVDTRCWLQPGEVEADSHGDWVHPRCNLRSHGERYVYAAAVHPDALSRVRRLFEERVIATIPDLEGILSAQGITYALSRRKRLLRSFPAT